MGLRLPTATRNAELDALNTLLNAGSGPGVLEIRSGSQPATANDAATGTVLATVTLGDPALGSPSAGTVAGADPAAVNASASGTAGWFRAKDSAGTTVFDGDVTDNAGSGVMKLSNTTLTAGAPVDITSIAITAPAGT